MAENQFEVSAADKLKLVKNNNKSFMHWTNCVRTCFDSRSFAVAAPTTWNSLPLHIRNSSSIMVSAVS